MKRRTIAIVLITMLLLLMAGTATANEQVTISVKPGFNGVYKISGLVPIQITVNNKGNDLTGRLVFGYEELNHYGGGAQHYYDIAVAAGEVKQLELLLPGELFVDKGSVRLMVREKTLAEAPIQGLVVRGDGILVLGLAKGGDIHSNLIEAGQHNPHHPRLITGKTILPQELPTNFFVLQGVDIIVLDQGAQAELSNKQQDNLDRWVAAGGTLIYSQGDISKGEPAAQVDGKWFFSRERKGNGQIIHSSYDLKASQEQYKPYESKLVQELSPQIPMEKFYVDGYTGNYWSYLDAASIFPDIKSPNLLLLAGIFIVYIALVAPILYYLLKKWDRRDLAWVIIPVCSIALTMSILASGKSRITGDGIIQTVASVNIIEPGMAIVQGATGIIVPKGGQYSFTVSQDTFAIPANRGMRPALGSQVVRYFADGTRDVQFSQVEYWSLRNLLVNKVVSDFGAIESQLAIVDGVLVGYISNKTGMDLDNVAINAGNMSYSIGKLYNGQILHFKNQADWQQYAVQQTEFMEKMAYERLTPQQQRLANAGMRNVHVVATPYNRTVVHEKEYQTYYTGGFIGSWDVRIMGWSNQELGLIETDSLNLSKPSLLQIGQRLPVDIGGANKVFFPMGSLQPRYSGQVDINYMMGMRSIDVQGSAQLIYELGDNLVVEELVTNIEPRYLHGLTYSAYNLQKKEWQDISQALVRVIGEEELKPFISSEGTFQLRITSETGRINVPEPAIQVLGRVKGD